MLAEIAVFIAIVGIHDLDAQPLPLKIMPGAPY
jgi:hypothetical protein